MSAASNLEAEPAQLVPVDMCANAHCTSASTAELTTGKVSWTFPKISLYDGKTLQRRAFEWIDARCDPQEYGRLLICGRLAGLSNESLAQWRVLRGISTFPKALVDGKAVDSTSFTPKSLVGWAVLKFGFNAEEEQSKALEQKTPAFQFHAGDDYAKDFIGAAELVEDILPAQGVAMIYGESGSGKTFWVLDLAFHIHNGVQWRDKDVAAGNAFYVAAEAGRSVKKRIQGVKVLYPEWKAPYVADMAPDLASPESMDAIREAIGDTPCAMIVIDTLSASFEGDDSSQKDTSVVIRNLKALSEALNCLVMFVHHTRKDGGSFRGSGVLKNDVDAVLEITTEGDALNRTHSARVEKSRDGEQGARYMFKLLRSDPLAYKPNGKSVTTCTVEHLSETTGEALNLPPQVQKLKDVYDEANPGLEGMVLNTLLNAAKTKYGEKYRADNAKKALLKHLGIPAMPNETVVFL